MAWRDILKFDSNDKMNIEKTVKDIIESEYTGWKIEDLYIRSDYSKLFFKVKIGNGGSPIACRVTKGRGVYGKPLEIDSFNRAKYEDDETFAKHILEQVKPTFRSLEWFYEVISPIEEVIDTGRGITVEGDSNNTYTILCDAIKTSGCYEVQTQEGFRICIEIEEQKPAGDNLLGLTLGLLNDELSRDKIQGIEDYLDNYAEQACTVCSADNEFDITNEEFTCYQCGANTHLVDISFEPSFTAEHVVQKADGPDGEFDPVNHYYYNDYSHGLFRVGNKIFKLGSPNDYEVTVAASPDVILQPTEYDNIWLYGMNLYDEEGEDMDLSQALSIIDDVGDFIKFLRDEVDMDIDFIYDYLEFNNVSGGLWTDRNGKYLNGSGDFVDSIKDIYILSEMTEEEFIMNAIEEWEFDEDDVLNLFDYQEDGEYWTKGGKRYELVDGEMVEQGEGGFTKNLSSKPVLPINMKWTDYLRKTSNTKAEDWESALKSFISDGKKLGIPLSVMELLKLAKEATTSQSEGFETLHRPTFSEEEEEDV